MKVIIKKPNEKYGVLTNIDNTLETLQEIVGGYIEVVPFKNCLVVCNEDGKLLGLEPNLQFGFDVIVGTIVVCGRDEEELTDIPITMEEWKNMICG